MLDLAHKYEEEIRNRMYDTWYDEKYKFYYSSSYHTPYESPNSKDGDWCCREFVSLDSQHRIIGLISYEIVRDYDLVMNFGAINFSDNKVTFGMDLAQVIDDIFCKFNMRKIEFNVVVGNPIEKSYDRLIKKYNGRIVGIRHKHCKLMDNKYYDDKIYELFREDYIATKIKHKKLDENKVNTLCNLVLGE